MEHSVIGYSNIKPSNVFHYLDERHEPKSVQVKNVMMSNNSSLELAFAVAGQGIVSLPQFCLNDELETGKLVQLFTDLPTTYIDVFVVYPTRKHLSTKVRAFIDFIVAELGE